MSFLSVSSTTETVSYSLPQAKMSSYSNSFTKKTFTFTKDSKQLQVVFMVSNDGVAFKYIIPGTGSASIYGEYSQFNLRDGTGGWAYSWRSDYEGLYEYKSYYSFDYADFAMPVLASINNNSYFVILTEAAVTNGPDDYCASHLHGGSGQVMNVVFAPEQTSAVSATYDFESPYRVIIIAQNLNSLVRSTLVTDLSPSTSMEDTSWIQPGKAAWSWWSEERSPQWYTRMKEYVDFADLYNWEYVTVDAGWDETWVDDLCSYANSKGVGIIIWTDIDSIDTPAELDSKIPTWAGWGIKGIKVDFMMNDSQGRMQDYEDIAEKCADYNLLVNFHGATKPTGEIREYPHLITSEAIRGTEHYLWSDTPNAYHNCVIPFLRNVIGPVDYTPCVISNTNRNTSLAHQLALSVVFESGIQHLADSIGMYEGWYKGTEFLSLVPATWDNTILVEGYPGNYASIARKSGNNWFIGAITDSPRTTYIPLSFLGAGNYTAYIYKDGATDDFITKDIQTVTSNSTLQIPLLDNGGCAVYITQGAAPSLPSDGYSHYEAESGSNTKSGTTATYSCSNASGGYKVGYIGNGSNNYLQFNNVYAANAGNYILKVYYTTGSQRNMYVSVNGGGGVVMTPYVTGDFNVVGAAKITVYLNQGNNTIKFYNNSAYAPDIDQIAIKYGSLPSGTSYEAESGSNTLTGAASVANCSNCSGGKKVGYIGNNAGSLRFNNISVGSSGTYLMRIYYLTESNRTVFVKANSGTEHEVLCFDSGSFNDVEYKEILISLNAGSNYIDFYNPNSGNYAPDIDRIVIIGSY